MSARPKNVFILGTAYCGSTLLGNALNAHSSISFAGEVSRLPAFGVGEPWSYCPVCSAQDVDCPIWSTEFVQRVSEAGAGEALDLFREAAQKPIVVDGSKHVAWLRQVNAKKALGPNTFALICVRTPFGFAASAKRREGFPMWVAGNIWRDTVYDILRCVGDLGIPHAIIRYEDFSRDPETVLQRICAWLDVDHEPGMLQFWETPVHAIGGNAGAMVWYKGFQSGGEFATEADKTVAEAYQQRSFGGWSDDKWRYTLTHDEVNLLVRTPSLMDMCNLAGYDVGAILATRPPLPPPPEPAPETPPEETAAPAESMP